MAELKLRPPEKRAVACRAKAEAAFPVFVYLLYAPGHAPPEYITWGTIFVSVLVLMKHYENMERLIAGEEPRLRPPKR